MKTVVYGTPIPDDSSIPDPKDLYGTPIPSDPVPQIEDEKLSFTMIETSDIKKIKKDIKKLKKDVKRLNDVLEDVKSILEQIYKEMD